MVEETGFASPTGIQWQGNTGMVEYGGGDAKMVVMFYNKPVHHPGKSLSEGRPVFEDKVFVRVHPPGERLNIVDTPATDVHKRRWPMHWQQFLQNKVQTPDGTPVDMLYPDKPAIAATLKANAVHTVEACAELSAHAIESIGMGAQTWVNDAQRYLKAAQKGVGAAQFRKELADRDQQIKILTSQLAEQKGQIDKLIKSRMEAPSLTELQRFYQQNAPHPQHVVGESFDPQMEQLNATHGSGLQKKAKTGRSRDRVRLRA